MWILHQQGPYSELDNLRILPSDGLWQWSRPSVSSQCFGVPVSVFTREGPDIAHGLSHRDQIPTPSSIVDWMLAYRDEAGTVSCGSHHAGGGFHGAFDTSFTRVFSPSSDPASLTWGGIPAGLSFEVLADTLGTITMSTPSDPLTLSPARRVLGPWPSRQGPGPHALAWGAQWPSGPTVESDVTVSELQRTVGNGNAWSTVYAGPALAWADSSMVFDSTGSVLVRYRVRVQDGQGTFSMWSMEHVARANASTSTAVMPDVPVSTSLLANYPNPFNPSTSVVFTAPTGQPVRVDVVDILGCTVRTLYEGRGTAGSQTVLWDGKNGTGVSVAGGVYLCRLLAPGLSLTRAMMFLK